MFRNISHRVHDSGWFYDFFCLVHVHIQKKILTMKTNYAYVCFVIFVLFIKFAYIVTAVYLRYLKRHTKTTASTTSTASPSTASPSTASPPETTYSYRDIESIFSKTSTPEETMGILFYLKERLDFLYVLLMSVFLIVFFSRLTPSDFYAQVVFERETKILLVFLGIILLIEAPWKQFVHESPWVSYIQNVV